MYCLVNSNKLRNFKFGAQYTSKISDIEKELRGVQTTFRLRTKEGLELETICSISEGIQFFREHDISDKHIYLLLAKYNEARQRT